MEAFDFPKEVRAARRGLEMQLVEYVAEHPEMSYRELRVPFNLSLGALSKIMKRHAKLRRNLIRRKAASQIRNLPKNLGRFAIFSVATEDRQSNEGCTSCV